MAKVVIQSLVARDQRNVGDLLFIEHTLAQAGAAGSTRLAALVTDLRTHMVHARQRSDCHLVGPGAQIREGVSTDRSGVHHDGAHRTLVIRTGQRDRHAGDTRGIHSIAESILAAIDKGVAAEGSRFEFTEVVSGSHTRAVQHDFLDLVAVRVRACHHTRGVMGIGVRLHTGLAIQIARRFRGLLHGIARAVGWRQLGETVARCVG
ncbi:hypothetical protein D3C78_1331500 [compost metagenome]